MKIIFKKNRKRGSALILAILVTMLLFLIGMGFISMMITDKASVARIDDQAILDNAVDKVVNDIQTTLRNDLFEDINNPTTFLTGAAAYDYPDKNNIWLASLEPELYDDTLGTAYYYWPHITDLWGYFGPYDDGDLAGDINDNFTFYYDPDIYDPVNKPNYRYFNLNARHYLVNNTDILPYSLTNITRNPGTICRIVGENEYIYDAWLNYDEQAPWGTLYNQANFITQLVNYWNANVPGLGLLPTDTVFNPLPVLPWLAQSRPWPTLTISGMRADADGDGVADSRWVRLYRIDQDGPWDHAIYAAVRIIDNGGMLNLNTALESRDGRYGAPAEYSSGNLLSDVNLLELRWLKNVAQNPTPLANNIRGIHGVRSGGNMNYAGDPDLVRYHNLVSMSILNPDPLGVIPPAVNTPTPFDISDELELRNRYFLFSPNKPRFTQAWPFTLNPPTDLPGYGKMLPYTTFASLQAWYRKSHLVSGFADYYHARHITTAYNFDRTACPGVTVTYNPYVPGQIGAFAEIWPRKMGVALPSNNLAPAANPFSGFATQDIKNMFIDQLAGAIRRGLDELDQADVDDRFSDKYTTEELAWQYAVNIVDYQDDDDGDPLVIGEQHPTHRQVLIGGETVDFFGVESPRDMLRNSLLITAMGYRFNGGAEVFALEIFNPTDDDIVLDNSSTPILDFKITNVMVNHATNPDIDSLFDVLDAAGVSTTIEAKKALVIGNRLEWQVNNAFDLRLDAETYLQLNDLSFNEGDQVTVFKLEYPDPGVDMPIDCFAVPAGLVEASGDLYHCLARSKEIGDGSSGANKTHFFLSHPESWIDKTTDDFGVIIPDADIESIDMQSKTTNQMLKGIGEIENVFALGYRYNQDTEESFALTNELGIVYELDPADEEAFPTIAGSELKSWGRINLRNEEKKYWPLLDFLTLFDASTDGLDNNGNGLADEFTEVALPGRININTAPWYVIKQLPWVMDSTAADPEALAHAIVGFRDKKNLELLPIYGLGSGMPDYSDPILGRTKATIDAAAVAPNANVRETPGFRHIAELLQIVVPDPKTIKGQFDIRKYFIDEDAGNPLDNGRPDFSGDYPIDVALDINDGIANDFEERDLIFNRISNLVTVRSDVFTAYILVRIGRNGPQKRMIATFDRSNVFNPMDVPKLVKLVALHPVPDPR